jgi:hypothetical protein
VKTLEDLAEMTVMEFRAIVPEEVVSSDNIEEIIQFAKKNSKEED